MKNPEATLARVLVVDSIPESAGLIELILRKYGGNEILRAKSVDEAIDLIASESPELILLDADLPGETALKFCRQIGKHDETNGIPIILFSDTKDRRKMVQAFDAGAVDFMFKPIYPMELAARARSHLLIKRQYDALQQKALEHKELVQVMCHDISGPVSASINLLEMSREEPEMLQQSIDLVIASLNKIMELTALVRKMRSFEDGKMDWKLVPVPLAESVQEALTTVQQRLKEKQIEVKVAVNPSLVVEAEPVSLVNSVLANLLTNAIKFSHPESSIEIKGAKKGDRIVLTIRDHGIGMPEKIRKNLFSINVPTSRPGTRNEQGTGFGMPLVQKFMRGYEGSIEITSKELRTHPDDPGTQVELSFAPA
jgi:two-component system sensor histidine kinase/response regulator